MKRSVRPFIGFALCILCLAILSDPGFAQELRKDLEINAEYLHYDDEHNLIEATGSVEALYRNFKVSGYHLVYHTDSRKIVMDQGFEFDYDNVSIKGEGLEYLIEERTGSGTSVEVVFEQVRIRGRDVLFDDEKIEVVGADFNACGLDEPHYHLSSRNLTLYPKTGWIIAFLDVFYLHGMPVVWVPLYIYDVEAQKKGRRNILPLPSIGSNGDDGFYISEDLAWHHSRNLLGFVNLNYAEKKGWGGGVSADYKINPDSESNLRIFGNNQDNIWGGLTYYYYFGPTVSAREGFVFGLASLPDFKQFELKTDLSYRERVNYERVSKLPEVTLSLNEGQFRNLYFDGALSVSVISEESTAKRLNSAKLLMNFSYPVRTHWFGTITPLLKGNFTYYQGEPNWYRLKMKLQQLKWWGTSVQTLLGYSHFLINQNQSPFNFENYRFVSSDQVELGLLTLFYTSKFGVSAVYNMPEMVPWEIDYLVSIGIHCYSVSLTYRAMRNEFVFGFSLI